MQKTQKLGTGLCKLKTSIFDAAHACMVQSCTQVLPRAIQQQHF